MRLARLHKILTDQIKCQMGILAGAFFCVMSDRLLETDRVSSHPPQFLMECTMIDVDKTRSVLDRIAHPQDLVGLVCGFGLGASTAIDNWIANAEDVVANQDEFGIHFLKIWFETFDFSRRGFCEKRTCTPVALQNPCRGQGRNLRIH